MYCDLGQGPVMGGPLVNSSKIVVNLTEYLVLGPVLAFPADLVDRCVVLQRNCGVSLHPELQIKSWASPASDAQDVRDATNNFCWC